MIFKKDSVVRTFRSHSVKAGKYLDAFCRSGATEQLHIFRIEIKKLNALLTILKSHPNDGTLLKQFAPVLTLFKRAGQVRLLDVNIKLVSRYISSNDLAIQRIEVKRKKALLKFVHLRNQHQDTLKKSVNRICVQFFDIEGTFLIEGITKKLKKIEKEFGRKTLRTHKLHRRRKQIKVILYLCEMLPETISRKLKIKKKYLEKIQHEIGSWHDLALSYDLFKESRKPDLRIVNELLKEKKDKEKNIVKLMNGYK